MSISEAVALYNCEEEEGGEEEEGKEEEKEEEENENEVGKKEEEKKETDNKKYFFSSNTRLVGAISDIKIPNIIAVATMHYNGGIAPQVFELLALYCPLIQTGDGIMAWEYGSWKMLKSTGKNVSSPIPELEFVVNVYLKKKNQKGKEIAGISLVTVIGNILAYWKGVSPFSFPSTMWKFNDCSFLTGINKNVGRGGGEGELIDILPLPMYKTRPKNSSSCEEMCLDSYQTDELVRHMNFCPFVQHQLFPLVRQILKKAGDATHEHQITTHKRGEIMRSVIDSRDTFTDNFDDVNVRAEMEVDGNHQGVGDARSTIPCRMDKFLSERRRLTQLTKDQYHTEFVETNDNSEEVGELIKLVKHYVLKQMCSSVKDLTNVLHQCGSDRLKEMISKYKSLQTHVQKKEDEPQRMQILSSVLHDLLRSHPQTAQLSDIDPHQMTVVGCNCPVSYAFINLLQTFSYDVVALRYILSVILSAVCFGNKLKEKQVYFFLGNTNSGKTNFLRQLLSVLGGMAGIISPHTAYHGSSQDRIHDLGKSGDTARFWYMDEIGQKPFNRQLINQITGNSPLFVRTNYSEGKMIQLAPSIFIFGNNSPTFNENCPALMERLRFFTFRSQFNSKTPICFKYSRFPQLESYGKIQEVLTRGLAAILLHCVCSASSNSPFYVYDMMTSIDIPNNVRDSSVMYSPVTGVVKTILQKCGIEEEPSGVITVKRLVHLLKNLNVLKYLNISSTNDALKFIDYLYPTSMVRNDAIHCPSEHKDDCRNHTAIYQGLLETDMYKNNEKILAAVS